MTGEEQRFISLAQRTIDQLPEFQGRYQLWWPRRKLIIRRRGKRIPTLAPLFPGYLFLEAETLDSVLFHAVRRTTGFVRFLKNNDDIRPLSPDDLSLIRHFLSYGEIIGESRVTFNENNRIVVKDGPLAGLEGKIIKVDRRKRRAKVKLDMYENSFTVDFGFEILAPGNEPTSEEPA